MKKSFKGKSLLTLMEYTPDEINYIVDYSIKLKKQKISGIYKHHLNDKNIAMIFEKSSTRTRCATSVACFDEGAHAEFLSKLDIQLGKKESVKDTARVLGRMFDGILYRGFLQDTVKQLAEFSGIPVVNGLTDDFHPTQVLADLMTAKERFGSLEGLKMAYIGDGRNNMANTLLINCGRVGMDFALGAPSDLFPADEIVATAKKLIRPDCSINMTNDPFEAVKNADIVYTDVWVSMGEEMNPDIEKRVASLKKYQVNSALMAASGKPGTVFFHCLPASHEDGVHNLEVTEDVFESPNSLVFDQAENRMHTIKAILTLLIGD